MIDEYLKRWIIKAMEDFKVAKHELCLPEDEMATGAVCFHSQQLAEKLLKAYLISINVDFERTHDLKFLLERCIEQDNDFKKLEVGDLTSYAVEVRYPDEFFIPSTGEAKECFEIASRTKDFVFEKLGITDNNL